MLNSHVWPVTTMPDNASLHMALNHGSPRETLPLTLTKSNPQASLRLFLLDERRVGLGPCVLRKTLNVQQT